MPLPSACCNPAPRARCGTVHTVAVDVSSPDAVEAAAATTFTKTPRVDILVNNAGIAGVSKKMWECTPAEWQAVLQTNLFGVFLCCRALVPRMMKEGYGRIVSVTSVVAQMGAAVRFIRFESPRAIASAHRRRLIGIAPPATPGAL